jgi:hypothetical protein
MIYVPFWVLLPHLDAVPPTPFLKCRILRDYEKDAQGADGPYKIRVLDLEIKTDLRAEAIPYAYVIEEKDLNDWKKRIADWFLEYES